jgi:hypothetical protein
MLSKAVMSMTDLNMPESRTPTIEEVTPENIGQVEKDTMMRVSHALSVLEKALAEWEATEEKPFELEETFSNYRDFHDALERWEAKMLKARATKPDFFTRVEMLWEFVDICHAHE